MAEVDRVEVHPDADGFWVWDALDANRDVLDSASRKFDKRSDAVAEATALFPDVLVMVAVIPTS